MRQAIYKFLCYILHYLPQLIFPLKFTFNIPIVTFLPTYLTFQLCKPKSNNVHKLVLIYRGNGNIEKQKCGNENIKTHFLIDIGNKNIGKCIKIKNIGCARVCLYIPIFY